MESKITEIAEEQQIEEKSMSITTTGNNFELNENNCRDYLLNLVFSRCNASLSLKDAETVYRAIRYLRGQNQILSSLDGALNYKTAYNLIFNTINIAHSKGLLNIEEDSIAYYCIQLISSLLKEREK